MQMKHSDRSLKYITKLEFFFAYKMSFFLKIDENDQNAYTYVFQSKYLP
jgi:hypothetical protein